MMYNYPFFSFPGFRNYGYSKYYGNYSNMVPSYIPTNRRPVSHKPTQEPSKSVSIKPTVTPKPVEKRKQSNTNIFSNLLGNIFNQEDRSEDEHYFEIFGLKLYDDDILLIGLLFFLYKEDVKDQYLFIGLILLLLS